MLHSAEYRSPEAHDLAGRRILVVGGGDVAMDAARTALRLGQRTEEDLADRLEILVRSVRYSPGVSGAGGGDGGAAREALRHPTVKTCRVAEPEEKLIKASREHLQAIHGDIWDDPRIDLAHDSGEERYDVALSDTRAATDGGRPVAATTSIPTSTAASTKMPAARSS